MSAQRSVSNRTSQQSASNSDYTWEYEYYEIGPVSFEGLKAHKCKSFTYVFVLTYEISSDFLAFFYFIFIFAELSPLPHKVPENTPSIHNDCSCVVLHEGLDDSE